jgi:hypothetical protein
MIEHPALTPYATRYAAAADTYRPVSISVRMVPNARIVHYDPPTFDGLLSWCVVMEATGGRGLPEAPSPYDLPIPVATLWREPETGAPLHAATPLLPAGQHVMDVVTEIKRAQSGRFTLTRSGRFIISPMSGRWRPRRTPRPTLVAAELVATCVGDPAEIARLLALAAAIGKRRAVGFGQVETWQVDQMLSDWSLVADGRLTRSLPETARGLINATPVGSPILGAWSPPAWRRDLYRPCWPAGTEVV